MQRRNIVTVTVGVALCAFGLWAYARSYEQLGASVFQFFPHAQELIHEHQMQQQSPTEVIEQGSVKVTIFVYHSVRPHEPEPKSIDEFDITPELFERQLVYLKDHGFATISFDDLVGFFTRHKTLPPKSVILSFDDGWENQYTYAFPLLQTYHDTATFFIFTNALDYRHFLTWQEVQEMRQKGMEIGSHTKSHPFLNKISEHALRSEIIDSKRIIEKHLGAPITAFASPFGYFDDTVVSLIKEAGYTSGRTLQRGVYHTNNNLLQLKSVLVGDNFNAFKNVLGEDK